MTGGERAGSSAPLGTPVRTFLALFPPPATLQVLRQIRSELEPRLAGLRWTSLSNLHLTLRFFGDLERMEVQEITAAAGEVAAYTRPFALSLGSLGLFSSPRHPRVLWCGFERGASVLDALARTLERGFVERGLGAADKPFRPHITLGRWRRPASLDAAATRAIEETRVNAAFTAESITVVQSVLGGGTPRYHTLADLNLGGGTVDAAADPKSR